MGSLLAYSGITTKVKAMESLLITDDQFREMAALGNVSEAVEYLKRLPAYEDIFVNLDENTLHRAYIEQRLTLSQYQDFARLYRFASLDQRKFLDLYFMHYEITLIKRCIRNALSHRSVDLDLSVFQDFFDLHSRLDLTKLLSSGNLAEFISNLEGSPYYGLLAHMNDTDQAALFDYELQLDLLYFKTIWKVKGKYLSKSEQRLLTRCFGSNLDLLNIQWIYRSKKYYHLAASDIYALLIPISYRLPKKDIVMLAETQNTEEFRAALKNTYYGRMEIGESLEHLNLEDLYEKLLNHIYKTTSRRNPYSIAILNSYLYFKELEIQKIITTIESIRYGVDPAEILSYVVKD